MSHSSRSMENSSHQDDDDDDDPGNRRRLPDHHHQQQQQQRQRQQRKQEEEDQDTNTNNTSIRSNAMASRRLVEYFVVFSCEPLKRKSSLLLTTNNTQQQQQQQQQRRQEQQKETFLKESPTVDHMKESYLIDSDTNTSTATVATAAATATAGGGVRKKYSVRIPVTTNESDYQLKEDNNNNNNNNPSFEEPCNTPCKSQICETTIMDSNNNDDHGLDESETETEIGSESEFESESNMMMTTTMTTTSMTMTMTPSRIRAMDSLDSEEKEQEEKQGVGGKEEEEEEESQQQPQQTIDNGNVNLSSNRQCSSSDDSKVMTPSRRPTTPTTMTTPSPVADTGNIHLPGIGTTAADIAEDVSDDPLACNFTLKPVKTAQYPLKEHPDCPLNPMVSHFCFPQVLNLTMEYQMPRIHFFVLTNEKGKKLYGTALTVWEEYCMGGGAGGDDIDGTGADADDTGRTTEIQREISKTVRMMCFTKKESIVDSSSSGIDATSGNDDIEVSLTEEKDDEMKPVYVPKVLCILSAWPYLDSFREYLAQLYRLATMTNLMHAPIERYVQNICDEAPAPPPGMFELQIKILSSTIKFWSPPGDQPIAYVALPFHVLFECLDLDNIIIVWYALTLERKVLLVSSQCSLLTICAEILCSLLFPMKWSHLYIPILPRFLSPMLDAPMPYLCGITRQNFTQSISDINDETIVVDLDQNIVTMGEKTPPFPPLPVKRRSKLEKNLQRSVGEVFWRVRGLTQADVLNREGNQSKVMKTAESVWREKLSGYDDAFSLAFTPDSETLLNGDSRQSSMDDDISSTLKQSAWDSVQETFLRFYVSMLRDYSKYIFIRKGHKSFKTEEFVSSQRADYRYFLREFCSTQQFDCFVTKRMNEPMSPDVIFFDQSITAKKNRSKMTLKKKDTAFLISAKARRKLRPIEVVQPSYEVEVFSNLLDQIYAATNQKKNYFYKVWPRAFNKGYFGSPRPIPTAIAAEFSRMDSIMSSVKLGHEDKEEDDFCPGVSHSSVEVATFTLFFSLYCKLVGSDFEMLRKKLNPARHPDRHALPSVIISPVETDKIQSPVSDCGTNICGSVSKNVIMSETIAMMKPFEDQTLQSYDTNSIGINADATSENELETAQLVAMRQLDLAFSVLETMCLRSLPADQDAFKILMEACGRCGSTRRATQLITMMKDQYLPIDSEIYSNYLSAFSVANELNPDELIQSPFTNTSISPFDRNSAKINTKNKWFSRVKTSRIVASPQKGNSFESNETSSNSAQSDSSHGEFRKGSRPGSSRKPLHRRSNVLPTNEMVERYLMIGECLLKEDVHGGTEINSKGDNCPQCTLYLTIDQIMEGWSPCSYTEYKTRCLHCKYKFLPRFVVKSQSPNFKGTQGAGTPLYCEFFSPWVLRREIFLATSGGENISVILDPQKREESDFNNKLWWNLIVHLRMQNIPITFLFQGYFTGGIIL